MCLLLHGAIIGSWRSDAVVEARTHGGVRVYGLVHGFLAKLHTQCVQFHRVCEAVC